MRAPLTCPIAVHSEIDPGASLTLTCSSGLDPAAELNRSADRWSRGAELKRVTVFLAQRCRAEATLPELQRDAGVGS
jgi:type II secretory pathway component PulJ